MSPPSLCSQFKINNFLKENIKYFVEIKKFKGGTFPTPKLLQMYTSEGKKNVFVQSSRCIYTFKQIKNFRLV